MADRLIPTPRALTGQRITPTRVPGKFPGSAPAKPVVPQSAAPLRESPVAVRRFLGLTLPSDQEGVLRLILIGIIALLGLVVIGELVFQVFMAPQMHIQRITLDSDLSLSRDEILKTAGVTANELFYAIDPQSMEDKLSTLPAVREARVTTVFPDTLSIFVRSRTPVAVSLARLDNDKQVPVLIDETGTVYGVGLTEGAEPVPVLSGIEFRNFRPGLHLPTSVVPLLQDLQTLRMQDPSLYHAFSEFQFVPVGTAQVEVLAYMVTSPIAIRMNPRLSPEAALYMLRTLEMLARTEGVNRIREIDFRTNNVVYKRGDN